VKPKRKKGQQVETQAAEHSESEGSASVWSWFPNCLVWIYLGTQWDHFEFPNCYSKKSGTQWYYAFFLKNLHMLSHYVWKSIKCPFLLVGNVRYYSNSSWAARSVALFSGPWCDTSPGAQRWLQWSLGRNCSLPFCGRCCVINSGHSATRSKSEHQDSAVKKTDNDAPLLCIPLELCQMNLNLTHTVPRKQSTGSWHTISQLLWSGTSSNHIYQFKTLCVSRS
jgi:hypothetical protein